MFFKKKNKPTVIKTTIIRTGSQYQHQQKVKNEAYEKASICPECGYDMRKYVCDGSLKSMMGRTSPLPMRRGTCSLLISECVGCNAKWEVEYEDN